MTARHAGMPGRIAENLAEVRGRIAAAAVRSGRAAGDVALVAVTKYVGPEQIRALVEASCLDLGESRPQQLWQRAAELSDLPIRWQMIGHLQRNKVRRTIAVAPMIHSIDDADLLAAIDRIGGEQGLKVPVLLEVNTSGEASKDGLQSAAVRPLLEHVPALAHVSLRGLMCMAPRGGGLDAARRSFAELRRLRDRLRRDLPAELCLDELSMGMSGDYEVAIEEGATIVRIGAALFEGT